MAKRKRKQQTYFELLNELAIQFPEEYSKAKIHSDKVIDSMEMNSNAFSLNYGLDFVLYWLQIATYSNLIMDGLIDQIEAARKAKNS